MCILAFNAFAQTQAQTHRLSGMKLYLDGKIVDVKVGSGVISVETHDGDIDSLVIQGSVTMSGKFYEKVSIEDLQRGKQLKFYTDGRSTPLLIIDPDVQNIIPNRKLAATLKVGTSTNSYSKYSVSIEKTKTGKWKFWRNYSNGKYKVINLLNLTYKRSINSVTGVSID
jgi:hypothetical protein